MVHRAIARKEVILGLLLFLLAGGWFGWHHLVHPALAQDALNATAQAQGPQNSPSLAALQSCMDRALAAQAALDTAASAAAAVQHVSQIREALEPVFVAVPTQPDSPGQAALWRHSLAVLADAQMRAGQAGDAGAEAAALNLMWTSCPADAWACYFQIPGKCLGAVREGTLDDHARVAMLTATGFLYAQAGDRVHCDILQRKAISLYANLLETYDGWAGQPSRTFTPQGRLKAIGTEYYDYRNRMDRLAMYSADNWGMAVADGRCSLTEALEACDHRLFRASVRVRADRQTDPIVILHEEAVRELDFSTIADWFVNRAYDPQADWEHQRGRLIQDVGDQEVIAVDRIAKARKLTAQKRYADALTALAQALETEPILAETGVSLRCEIVSVLLDQQRYMEALGLLDDAQAVLQAGDPRLTASTAGFLRGRVIYLRMQCARGMKDHPRAIQLGDQIADDAGIPLSFRAHALLDLVQLYMEGRDKPGALDAYGRLAGLAVTTGESDAILQPILRAAQNRLARKGWLVTAPATEAAQSVDTGVAS